MLRNLAVGIDASSASRVPLEQAVELAAATGARLHLLTALGEISPLDEPLSQPGADVVVRAALGAEDEEEPQLPANAVPPHLDQARQLCHQRAVTCRLHLHRGEPWPWLAQEALVAQALVMGRRSLAHAQEPGLVLGRTLRRLLAAPRLPVLACARQVMVPRWGLALYLEGPESARALALTAEICVGFNIPLSVLAVAPRREEAGRLLERARTSLYAYETNCDFQTVTGRPAEALLEVAGEQHPSLVGVPARRTGMMPFGSCAECRVALSLPEAAVLFVP